MQTTAGKYRTRVTIKRADRTANTFNELVPTYDETYISRWAAVVPSSAREFIAAQQVNGLISAIVRVRSDSQTRAITPDMRIEIGNRVLNIGGVYDESDDRREVVLWCTEEA